MTSYIEMKRRHQAEVNDFPFLIAFSMDDLEKAMKEHGITDKKELFNLGAGVLIRKSDLESYKEMMYRHETEMEDAIKNDVDGEGFIYDMFYYELANHEYGYTYDICPTLDALGLSIQDVNDDEKLLHGLRLAKEKILEDDTYY